MAEPTLKPKRPPQTRTGLTDTGVKKAADKSARTRAREFALQALYQHLVAHNEADAIAILLWAPIAPDVQLTVLLPLSARKAAPHLRPHPLGQGHRPILRPRAADPAHYLAGWQPQHAPTA